MEASRGCSIWLRILKYNNQHFRLAIDWLGLLVMRRVEGGIRFDPEGRMQTPCPDEIKTCATRQWHNDTGKSISTTKQLRSKCLCYRTSPSSISNFSSKRNAVNEQRSRVRHQKEKRVYLYYEINLNQLFIFRYFYVMSAVT